MEVGFGEEPLSEVEVLFYPVPFVLVKFATAKEVDRRAFGDFDVGDDESGMVSRETIVNSIGKDSYLVVEE